MPSVSPSEGGYQYYQKTVADLEEDAQNEAKRAREREEARAARLEESYKEQLARRDRELEDTINDVKSNSAKYVADERAMARSEVDALKAQTYDKSGRYIGERDALQRQMMEQERSTEASTKRDQMRMKESQENYLNRSEDLHKEYEKKLENAVRDTRDSIINSTGKTVEERNREYEDNRQEALKRYEEIDRQRIEDLNFQRRQFDKAYGEAERDHEHRTKGVMEAAEKTVQSRQKEDSKRLEEDTRRINKSHASEAKVLRDQIKNLTSVEQEYAKGKAEGTSESVQRYEQDWRDRERMASESFQREIVDLKRQSQEADSYFDHLNTSNLREKDAYFAKLLKKQGIENRAEQKQLQDTFNNDREHVEKKMTTERRQAKQQLDTELKEADRARANALETQAQAYQNQMQRQRISTRENTEKLEKALQTRQTTSDASEISPAAEANVRKSITKEYEKQFGEERDRNKRAMESMQQEYVGRVKDTINQSVSDRTRILRAHAAESSLDRSQFLENVNDAEQDKKASLNHQETDFRRQTQALDRSHGSFVEKQRRDYEEILQAQKDESTARIQATRQQADFDLKMAQRAFSAKQNEITRDYDKKLADQKQEYESRLDEMKGQSQLSLREADRKNRMALDEAQRLFDQRIAQLESQHKERERYITQNYQEDLEKVKRSNAALIQKKS